MIGEEGVKVGTIKSDEANSQIYFTNCPLHLNYLVKAKKGIIYYNEGFVYGLFGDKSLINEKEFKTFCEGFKSKETKDDQNEQNEDYNEIDNKKNKNIYKSNEEYDSNYERRNEIIDLDKDDEDSRVYNKYNNNKNRIKESKKEIDQRQDENLQDPNINYSNKTKNINNYYTII